MDWCGFSFHWNASLSASSLWYQKWLLSHLSARQGLSCYFSRVCFLSSFSNSVFQLLWVSLSIFTCHFEEGESFATLFTDCKCYWKYEGKETDLGFYNSLFQNFLFVFTLDSSQEILDKLPTSSQIFCCLLKKKALVSEVQNNKPNCYSYLEHII